MSSEENENKLINSNTGGLIRKMDHQLEVMNRVLGEITERKTEIITQTDSLIGLRAGEERDWEIAPGVKMTFCWCPPGDFLMGSPKTEVGRLDNEEIVRVTLTKGFWMAKTQVTQKQWTTIMDHNPSDHQGENLPVEGVSWHDAQEFLHKINAKIGNTEGWMALPTEAQWEYACRAGEDALYSGNKIDEMAWYENNSGDKTHPVGTKIQNAWGLHDMLGNVFEWCADWYGRELSGGFDPTGPSSGKYRVGRGGCFGSDARSCRPTCRYSDATPTYRLNYFGFRIALNSV